MHCGKTADRIRMPFGIIGRAGPGMTQVMGVWGSVHGKGYFWGHIWGAPLYPMGTLRRTCATVPQPSELRFKVVLAASRGTAVLDGGQCSPTGRGGFGKCHWIADGEFF